MCDSAVELPAPADVGSTSGFRLHHTMLRVRDPVVSTDFYTRVMGMTLLAKLPFDDMGFTLFFMGYAAPADVPAEPLARARAMFNHPGAVLELTHNHGTELDAEFKGYHNGNAEPKGFGHICVMTPSVAAACARFESLGVEFVKRPDEGKMRNVAFILDPDGYWIEVLEPGVAADLVAWPGAAPKA
jgi:lactoylglutathione lyase